MKIQLIKPRCVICKYHNYSTFKGNDGWCSHIKLSGRKIPDCVAEISIQPDCPFRKGIYWSPEIEIQI